MIRTSIPLLLLVGCALGDEGDEARQAVVIQNNESQPVYSYQDAIRQAVWVESAIDSDHDGLHDRIAVDIMRPKETDHGLKAATVMEASPYYSDTPLANPPPGLQIPISQRGFGRWYDEFFVP